MSLTEDLMAVVHSEAYAYFSKAKAVNFDGMRLYYDKKDQRFHTKTRDFNTNAEELASRVTDIVIRNGIEDLWAIHHIYAYNPSVNELRGFATVVYGKKVAKQIKKNPRKSGKAMKKAFRGMF